MSDYTSQKTYYMETNALYALSKHFDNIANSNVNVATSLFALQEIVDGIEEDSFRKRKILLNKICSSSVLIYPYLPKECITTAFHLDISELPQIIEEKAFLLEQLKLIRSSDSFDEYRSGCQAVQKLVDENATRKPGQHDYLKKYDGYVSRYAALESRMDSLGKERERKEIQYDLFRGFLAGHKAACIMLEHD